MGEYPFFTCGVEVYKTLEYAFDCDAVLLGGNNASDDYKMHRYCGNLMHIKGYMLLVIRRMKCWTIYSG